MNLKAQLLARILIIALLCLTGSAWYVLYQTDKQAIYEAQQTANRVVTQTRQQLLNMFQRYEYTRPFPDINQWRSIGGVPGSCTQFLSRTESRQRSLCNDISDPVKAYPSWFGTLYQQFFSPDYEVRRPVSFNAIQYGTVLVTLNVQMETTRAWNNLTAVIGIISVSFITLCVLMFWVINRMLRPAQRIVSGLEKIRGGALDHRLPSFDITEWRRTSEAINALVSSQQHTLAENKRLAVKLMYAQEEEHRYISRELHDEFGQCLAGINAVSASIAQTARKDCPDVLEEVQTINHITAHMMKALRNLLTRLRPTEVDELGLCASLSQLVKSWNQRNGNQTRYQLDIDKSLDNLPDPLPVNIYRIVQECLTNIAKHAQASKADISVRQMTDQTIRLTIRDDGIAKAEAFDNTMGIGLFGIHERVTALGGKLSLQAQRYGGLLVTVSLPLPEEEQESEQDE
jgi:two-component system, NarL family, sensor histidine kinase UhpB